VIVTAPPAKHWGHGGEPGPITGVTMPPPISA
jgi:hypothetical protein